MRLAICATIVALVALSGCKRTYTDVATTVPNVSVDLGPNTEPLKLLCLDNVKYWSGHNRLTPYVNPNVLTFERCN